MSGKSLGQNNHNGLENDSENRQKGLQGQVHNADQRQLQLPKQDQENPSLNIQSRKVMIDDTKNEVKGKNLKMEIPDVPSQFLNMSSTYDN